MKARYKSKNQDYLNEHTIYWFDIVSSNNERIDIGEVYGRVEGPNYFSIVDGTNCPVCPEDFHSLENVLIVTDEMRDDF